MHKETEAQNECVWPTVTWLMNGGAWIGASQTCFVFFFLFNHMLPLDEEAILFEMNIQALWGAPPPPNQGEASGRRPGNSRAVGAHGWKIIRGLSAARLKPKTHVT